jgi:hypothetical protein
LATHITAALAAYIAIGGRTSWLERAQLLALWGILALFFILLSTAHRALSPARIVNDC